jgi:hypothetical protein
MYCAFGRPNRWMIGIAHGGGLAQRESLHKYGGGIESRSDNYKSDSLNL